MMTYRHNGFWQVIDTTRQWQLNRPWIEGGD